MIQLPHAITSPAEADAMLEAIVRFTREDLPFLANVAQLALQSATLYEQERALASLYRLGLEHGQPYVADLTDELLAWIERELEPAA